MIERWVLVAALLLAACGDDDGGVDAGARDAGALRDASSEDAFVPIADAGASDAGGLDGGAASDAGAALDAGTLDAGAVDAGALDASAAMGFGLVTGTCGLVAAEVASPDPSYFVRHLDFMDDGFDDPEERDLLTADAVEILEEGTVGGSSEISEAFAMEVLARCEGASLLLSEGEVDYEPPSSAKTDMVVSIGGARVGVSVVRAFRFPLGSEYRLGDDTAAVERKFGDILESSANVVEEHAWVKQILAVLAYADQAEEVVAMVHAMLEDEERADTIVYVIVTDGDDAIVYD